MNTLSSRAKRTGMLLMCIGLAAGCAAGQPVVEEKIVVDKVWSAVKVGFALRTHGDRQYIAYYNADRRMVVGHRALGEKKFTTYILPSESDEPPRRGNLTSTIQGWDSHNYVTLAVDAAGCVHLSGNMHVDPLLYFRTDKPGDVTTMKQVKSMVGDREDKCTYPRFTTGPDGELLFHYRDGWSGNGQEVYNAYDAKTRRWRRFLDKDLISGQGKRNAYQRGPVLGPDGWYHLIWMWRETYRVETNNNISYARSRDLRHWQTAAGEPLDLPITRDDRGTIVDPVPVGGGLHNSNHRLGFDSKNRPVVGYFKHDADGNTQAYLARFDDGKWRVHAVSKWHGRHVFKGGGSGPATFGTSIGLGSIERHGEGKLSFAFRHWKEGRGLLIVDEDTLELVEVAPPPAKAPRYPAELTRVASDFPGMAVRWRGDSGKSPDPASRYVLRWETLGTNRDRPRTGDLPADSDLVLYKLTTRAKPGSGAIR